MRETARQLADRLHLLRLMQTGLRLHPAIGLRLEGHGALAHALLERLVHLLEGRLGGSQLSLGSLPIGDVEIDPAVADRCSVRVANDSPAAEDPSHAAIRVNHPIFHLVRVASAFERIPKTGDDARTVVRMAKRAQRFDRHLIARRLESHDAEELRGAAHKPGLEIDAPHADACGLLGERQRIAVEQVIAEIVQRRPVGYRSGSCQGGPATAGTVVHFPCGPASSCRSVRVPFDRTRLG